MLAGLFGLVDGHGGNSKLFIRRKCLSASEMITKSRCYRTIEIFEIFPLIAPH